MDTRLSTTVLSFTLVVLLVLAVTPTAAQEGPSQVGLRPDAPPYALHGPYWVGRREFVVEPDSDRPLPLTVWYPAVSGTPEGEHTYLLETPPLAFIGRAIPDAVPAVESGPYPLVVNSYGAGVARYYSLFLAEHLASHGFVVMGPDHTGDVIVNAEDEGVFVRSHATRPLDITRVIDFERGRPGRAQS